MQINIPEATKQGFAVAQEGDSINLSIPNSKTRRGRVGKGVAQTLDTQTQQFTLKDKRIRRLTPIECCRLQGFPDDWVDGISDSQKYRCLGNAVTVNVVQAIMERLYGTVEAHTEPLSTDSTVPRNV
jgi:DNA (cytosine-5)-methyltransferase 1